MIFVNFKTYPQGTGKRAIRLARICQEVAKKSGVAVIPVVQVVDLVPVASAVKTPVWVQHLDWQPSGKWTGWINLEAVIEAGARGTLLNHSEHRLPPGTVKQTIKRIEKWSLETHLQEGRQFQVLVCCRSLGQAERLVKFKPDFLAYEPPWLIGSEIAVSTVEPEAIRHFVQLCGAIPAIVGAGIKKPEDVKMALKLGAKGILVSSGVVLAKKPKEALLALAQGFEK